RRRVELELVEAQPLRLLRDAQRVPVRAHAPATAREHALDADSQREILIRATVRRRHAVRYTVVQLAVAAQVGARHERGLIEAEPRAHVERNTRQLAPRAPAHEIHDDLRRAGWQPHTARTVADA